jgi:hypothetical protein
MSCFKHITEELYYNYILPNIIKPPMKLLDWIDIKSIGQSYRMQLSYNSNAIYILKENPDKINWVFLLKPPNIYEIDYVKWRQLMKEYYYDYIKN